MGAAAVRSDAQFDESGARQDSTTLSSRNLVILQAAIWVSAFLIFFASPVLQMNDSQYSMLTAESILHHHTPDLHGYTIPHYDADLPFNEIRGAHAYQLVRMNGKLLYGFPHGSSWLSLPFVAVMDLAGISPATKDHRYNLEGEVIIQKMLAALLMASLLVIIFRSALLLLDWRWSAAIATGAGFGTQIWSTASRGLWSHSWEIVLSAMVVYLLLSAGSRGTSIRPITLATLLSWMFFVRPTAAGPILCVSAYLLIFYSGDFFSYAATGTLWLFGFIAYSFRIFGTALPFYYQPSRNHLDSLVLGLFGNLFSPSRGIFIFCPVLAIVFYLVIKNWRTLAHRRLAIVSLIAIAAITFSAASFPVWWGGNCYGPRFLTDAVPWLVLLAILAVASIPPLQRNLRNPIIGAGALLLLVSVVINAHGAFSFETIRWNDKRPLPGVMLDWSRPQFLAGWIDER